MFNKSASKLNLVLNDEMDRDSMNESLPPDPETDYESVILPNNREDTGNEQWEGCTNVKDLAKKLDDKKLGIIPDVINGTSFADAREDKKQKLRFSYPEQQVLPSDENTLNYHENTEKIRNIHETQKVHKKRSKLRRKAVKNIKTAGYSSDSETSLSEEEFVRAPRKKMQGRELNDLDASIKEFENGKKKGYLNITVDQLNQLIKEKITSAMNNPAKKDDIELVNRNCNFILPDHDSTDTETMQSGPSYSSANSCDNLLPVKSKVKSGTMHLVHPSRVGILKRFLPNMNSEDLKSNSSSLETSETYLSSVHPPGISYNRGRRKSLQPELLRSLQSRSHDSLHQQSNILTGTNRMRHWKHFDDESSIIFDSHPTSYGCISKRSKFHSHEEDNYHCDDHYSYQGCCQNDRMGSSQHQQCCRRKNKRQAPCNCCHNDEGHHSNQHAQYPHVQNNMQMGIPPNPYVQPPVIPQMPQMPMPMMMSAPPPQPIALNQPENLLNQQAVPQPSVLQQLQDAIANKKDSEKDTKETENKPGSIKEILAARKKKEAEMKPIRIAKILSVVTNVFLFLCGAGTMGLGVWSMIDEQISMYTAVTKADKSDNSFQYFCYGLSFLGFLPLGFLVCGCCGIIKGKGTFLKVFGIAVITMLVLNVILLAVLFVSMESAVGIPMLTAIASGVLDNLKKHLFNSIKFKYLEDSPVATAWNTLQVMGECCGCEGPDDYKTSAWKNATEDAKQQIPNSCCVLIDKNPADPKPSNKLLCQALTTGFWHKQGCYEVIKAWYEQSSVMMLGAIGGLMLIQVLCIVCAFRLFKKLTERDKKEKEAKAAVKKKEPIKSVSS